MRLTVLIVIFASEILGIFGIIVYEGTKEGDKHQGSRRFEVQHAEPSQVSHQQVSPSDRSSSGFSSVVVHRPPTSQQSQDHSGGGLTVQDPPKGWPLSEMHVSFDSHGKDQPWKASGDVQTPVAHKQQLPHPNQVQQSFNKPQQEPHLLKQQHIAKRQPDPLQLLQQQQAQELHRPLHQQAQEQHRPLHQHHHETQLQNVLYQQQPRKQENLYQNHEKTEVEIHPQVIIKLPEQQTTRLLRPLYVQDQTFPQQLPPSLTPQDKPFHPSVQVYDSVNNEAMLTPVQYHGGHGDEFSPFGKRPAAAKVPEGIPQISNKPKKTYLAPGINEEKHPREGVKAVRMRHPQATLGASYSVGFTTPPDALKNSNQLQHLIIKEHVEHKVPVRHGKTIHRPKPANGVEISNEPDAHSKNAPPLQTNVSPEILKNENYVLLDGGHHHLGVPSTIHYQPPIINGVPSGAHSSPIRLHQAPNSQHVPSHLVFEEARQPPVGSLHYQKLITRDLLPPPVRIHLNPEGNSGGHFQFGLAPSRLNHGSPAPSPNKIISFLPGGPINSAFNEAAIHPSNLHYSPEAGPKVHHNAGGVQGSGHERGNQGSATTGNSVSTGAPINQNHGHHHAITSGGPPEFHGFSKGVPLYTTQGHVQHTPPKFLFEPQTQHIIETPKHNHLHTKAAASAQGIKHEIPNSPSQINNPGNLASHHGLQKTNENVFAGFKNGQFQGGLVGNVGHSLAGHDIRNPFVQQVPVGSNSGAAGQNVLQNIPGYLNVNNGALHLGHPSGPLLYPQQSLVQPQGGHLQTLYAPGAVYGNHFLGVGNVQPSAEVPVPQGHPMAGTPALYNGTPLTYYAPQLLNAPPHGGAEVNGPIFHQPQAATFPGIGAAYPQSVPVPFHGGAGTTFLLSQGPPQDYRQQHALPVGVPQQTSSSPSQANNIQTHNTRIATNTFGTKLPQQQQQHPASQHVTNKPSSSQQHQPSHA